MTLEATGPESLRAKIAQIICDHVYNSHLVGAGPSKYELGAADEILKLISLLPPTVQEDARVEQIITILRDTLFVQHGMEDSHHVFGVDGIGEAALAIARSGSGNTVAQALAVYEAWVKGPTEDGTTTLHEIAGLLARSGSGGTAWQLAEEPPSVKKEGTFIVAVKRAHNGKVYSFPATYLNNKELEFEDEDEYRAVTGWFSFYGPEDEEKYYPLLSSGDELIAWTVVPQYAPAPPPAGAGE